MRQLEIPAVCPSEQGVSVQGTSVLGFGVQAEVQKSENNGPSP